VAGVSATNQFWDRRTELLILDSLVVIPTKGLKKEVKVRVNPIQSLVEVSTVGLETATITPMWGARC